MYQAAPVVTGVLGAVVLPNTGNNTLMAVAATTMLVVGVAATATSVGRIIAKKAFKA